MDSFDIQNIENLETVKVISNNSRLNDLKLNESEENKRTNYPMRIRQASNLDCCKQVNKLLRSIEKLLSWCLGCPSEKIVLMAKSKRSIYNDQVLSQVSALGRNSYREGINTLRGFMEEIKEEAANLLKEFEIMDN